MTFNSHKTTMPKTRQADYCLSCLDDSVFMDFNLNKDNCIYLVRISFDGYGCCNLEQPSEPLNQDYSIEFINQMKNENLNQKNIENLVRELIELNKEQIWEDALESYGLVNQ